MYYIKLVMFLFLKQNITPHQIAYLREICRLSTFNLINPIACNVISTYLDLDWQDYKHC